MKVLITGGAGYIGSYTVNLLLKNNFEVFVLDKVVNNCNGLPNKAKIIVDLADKNKLEKKLNNQKFDAIVHLAASIYPGESMINPYKYYRNNIIGGLNILEFMRKSSTPYIINASSCAVYGSPKKLPVKENEPTLPESVYGETKLIFESILKHYSENYAIKYTNLRYFNVAGASVDNDFGIGSNSESRFIPTLIRSILDKNPIKIYGNNYVTTDGTCIRDYVHVMDVARFHLMLLRHFKNDITNETYNLGTGKGHSNYQLVKKAEKIVGKKVVVNFLNRRTGDVPKIYSDISKITKDFNFKMEYSDIDTIVRSTYEWYLNKRSKL